MRAKPIQSPRARIGTERAAQWLIESVRIGVLGRLAGFFIAASWRRSGDPLVDFGNGLYAAWRIAGGAVLYRDVSVDYGPLSQYATGVLFYLFGPGTVVVVIANLVV